MRGGALPPSLLCAALGFALAFAPRKTILPAVAVLAGSAAAAHWLRLGEPWPDPVFLCAWASIVLIAASIHLPKGVGTPLALVMALAAGLLAGSLTVVAGKGADLAVALPWVLLSLPAGWLVRRGHSIAIKVVGSWLIAVALLAAGLSMVPTPGYVPDHME